MLGDITTFKSHMIDQTILFDVNNPFIADLEYSFMSEDHIYLVMQFMSEGNLYERMAKSGGTFDEGTVRFFLT